jgi:hypothetical protein
MAIKTDLREAWEAELATGTALAKCRQCGCMKGALEEMRSYLSSVEDPAAAELVQKVSLWLGRMEASLYT